MAQTQRCQDIKELTQSMGVSVFESDYYGGYFMRRPIIWPRHAWRTKTYEEVEILISNWPKDVKLDWLREESRAYRKMLLKEHAARIPKKRPRPRSYHHLIEAVISYKQDVKFDTFWPIAKKIFESRQHDFKGIAKVDAVKRLLHLTSSKGAREKEWPKTKSAFTQAIKRLRKNLRR